jgi:non-ribosomal peptide synthetase component E (peptide arylation enzyme)
MRIFEKYAQADFTSYEDFKDNFKITVPERFNFAYDVLDELAVNKPDKTALYWTQDTGAKRIISFGEMKRLSDKAANYLSSLGIGKGDRDFDVGEQGEVTVLLAGADHQHQAIFLLQVAVNILPVEVFDAHGDSPGAIIHGINSMPQLSANLASVRRR